MEILKISINKYLNLKKKYIDIINNKFSKDRYRKNPFNLNIQFSTQYDNNIFETNA